MHLQSLVNTNFHYLSVNYLIDFFLWPESAAFEDLKAEKWIDRHTFNLDWSKGSAENDFPLITSWSHFMVDPSSSPWSYL